MNEADEARREPRAGDVWVSKRMTRMVMEQWCSNIYTITPADHAAKAHSLSYFRRWTRTATLVSRGRI